MNNKRLTGKTLGAEPVTNTEVSRETANAIKDGLTAIDNAVAEANITEYAENAIAEKINTVVEEKKRGGNILYSLKQFATMTNKLRDQKLIDGVQHATLQEMLKQIHAKYIGLDIWNGEPK